MGTWQIRKEEILHKVIDEGLRKGYRFIDTAQVYGNEAAIGRILGYLLPQHNLKREDIWITSKLAPANAGAAAARKSIEDSLKHLQVDYIDLLLIHWPGSSLKSENPKNKILREESWKIMGEMMKEGKLKSIGVSNFEISHLEELKKVSNVVPAVEYHPHFHQDDLVKYCNDNNIHFQAYSSLGSPTYREKLSKEPVIIKLAEKYGVSVPVILLGFAYCQGISILPRTTNPEHVVCNYEVTKRSISENDISLMLALKVEHKTCWDPRLVV
ncbi:hypothetical protein GCK72_010005 [Caenorhabditis remanei]|uniref:NADP-dependent oxidoreductase domain-containing protein n=1 Tax=Caenorhabditis remanei TaxID=31234 RepID=A0A6A5H419_CAERE|nr:hypothetical protein GCK72_010005 [Caenorhabditis remanei]KAF1761749.1 hypothetical protein GCK72_010005 [Caenorhabditis remanei]